MWSDYVNNKVREALEEDSAFADVTTILTIDKEKSGRARLIFKEEAIVCGLEFARAAFVFLDSQVEFKPWFAEGELVKRGSEVALVTGSIRAILSAERTALNFVSFLSGIATEARKYCEAIKGYQVKIYDTRKTHPGLRLAEKYAVRTGGGQNHRNNLSEAFFLKDNHLSALGGIEVALKRAEGKAIGIPFVVEVENLEQARLALQYKPDIILCDNMMSHSVKEIVDAVGDQVEVEVSGGIDLTNLEEYAMTGVKRISTSAIVAKAKPIDVSLELEAE